MEDSLSCWMLQQSSVVLAELCVQDPTPFLSLQDWSVLWGVIDPCQGDSCGEDGLCVL